jgi:hypothetical protein
LIPGPEQLIRTAVALPLGVARRVLVIVGGLLPGGEATGRPQPDAPPRPEDVEIAVAADDAMTRERDPIEEAALLPDDDLGGHVEPEVELVAESTDPEATEPPGPEIHVEDRR